MTTGIHDVEHEIDIDADADAVYELLRDVTNWPRIFPPTVYVERDDLGSDDDGSSRERMHIWARANDEVKHWTSLRTLSPSGRRIDFRQEVSAAPVASMGGAWIVEPRGSSCRVRLLHDYSAVDEGGLGWVARAVEANSTAELASLKRNVEAVVSGRDRVLDFVDTVEVDGLAEDVYDFLDQAQLWTERLPHVAAVRLTEESPGVQELAMDTRTADGTTHTTTSIRICQPHRAIHYKQTQLPLLMTLHTGRWTIEADGGVLRVSSQHTVEIDPDKIERVLGADATLDDARTFVHKALSGNSSATLGHAKRFAESRALAGRP